MNTVTATATWKDLIVTDAEGYQENLESLLHAAPANLDNAKVENGAITEWEGFFLSLPGQEPSWETPQVDWSGFESALNVARSN